MNRVKILVCGFSLAIALVALPFPYIDDITSGLGFSIAAVLFAWLGILERRGAKMVTNVMCGYIQPVP